MKYTKCEHNWKLRYAGKLCFAVECVVCHLQVEGYRDHVSLHDYTRGEKGVMMKYLEYPDPEDEEATELEPEEVTVDAEGGGV